MTRDDRLHDLLDRHGRTFADEAGLTLRDKPAPLFGLLVLTSLLAANLDPPLGVRAARAVRTAFRTPARLAEATEPEVHDVLAEAKYLRKHQTARQLISLAEETLGRHDGDLRTLSPDDDAGAADLVEALCGFTGIGEVGAQIFCREVQAVWPTLRPYVDDRLADLARRAGLPHTASGLASLAGTDDLSVVGAALIRADRAGDL